MILVVDHYDSFIDMIMDYLIQLNAKAALIKTDEINQNQIKQASPEKIILGPGPGHPTQPSLKQLYKLIELAISIKIPILGICLGHQVIAEYFNAKVVKADFIAHGIVEKIQHNSNSILFDDVANNFHATRYHSLLIDEKTIEGTELIVTAQSEKNEIMAVQHITYPIYGIQFHPESVMTTCGKKILLNFLKL